MKKAALLFVLMFAGIAFGQALPASNPKIAELDTDRLFDSTRGVSKLVSRYREICCIDTESTMGGSSKMKQQIAEIENEIAKLKCSNSPIAEKEMQLADLKLQYTKSEEVDRAAYQMRYSKVVEPIIVQIRTLLKEYAALNGYQIILDKSKASFLSENPEGMPDITDDFIRYCNNTFAVKK